VAEISNREHAVVIGAGIAGLLAAPVLARHFRRVTLVDRDRFGDQPGYRKGVPQSRHTHLLLGLGLASLERQLPGIGAELVAEGAVPLQNPRDARWLTPAGWCQRFDGGMSFVSASRDLIEWVIRRRVLAQARLRVLTATEAVGLLPSPNGRGIAGVRLRSRAHGGEFPMAADLVLDASGRSSRAPEWLTALGWPTPREVSAPTGVGYASRFYANPGDPAQDWKFMLLQTRPPEHTRSGMLLPVDGDRWMVSLVGVGGDHPPTDDAGFLEFAATLRSPVLYEAIRDAVPLSPVHAFRVPDSRRRRYDQLRRWPHGFALVGDAVCSLNPMYAQGMSIAAATALALEEELGRRSGTPLGRRVQRRAAKVAADAWLVASGEDLRYLTASQQVRRPAYLTLMQGYFDRVLSAAGTDARINAALLPVINLQASPWSLLRPAVAVRALRIARGGHATSPEAPPGAAPRPRTPYSGLSALRGRTGRPVPPRSRRRDMSRWRTSVAVLAVTAATAGTAAAAAAGPAQAATRPADTILAGSSVPFAGDTQATGVVSGSTRLTVELWLKPRLAAAERFAGQVSTPGRAQFRHYLSPAAYTARFGASRAAAAGVESWLRAEGFSAIKTDSGRSYVRASAPVSQIDAAFRVRLLTYRASASVHADGQPLYANNRAVSLPASLAGGVLAVTGLDNAALITPLVKGPAAAKPAVSPATPPRGAVPCSHYYGQHMAAHLPRHFGVTSFPTFVCGYTAWQMRKAYHAGPALTGQGQTVALVEVGLTKDMFLTLRDYAKANHMPAPSPDRYAELSIGSDTCGDPFNLEEQLDVESAYDMAPGANELVVGGNSCQPEMSAYNADIAILDGDGYHPLATVASNSWETGRQSQPLSQTKLAHAYLVRAAAEGVGMYFSAGDVSGIDEPSIDPDAIAVGGTTLGVGKTGNRLFETGWSDGISQLKKNSWAFQGEVSAGGGGSSDYWAQPAYQKGVVPKSLGKTRSAPDIAADGDPDTGINVGMLRFGGKKPVYFEESIGGSSESAPLVAGLVTAAQQGTQEPFGFINPAIYQLNGTTAFFPTLPLTSRTPALYRGVECDLPEFANICLSTPGHRVVSLTTFDDQNPKMKGYLGQVTLPGFDNMTGVGTPDLPVFARDMRSIG
jgi:2-polyprenyl-6-methoxyphenol hydroxylase-like FAD-dependent oxidoreductase